MSRHTSTADAPGLKRGRSKCVCANVRRASRVLTRLYDRVMAPSGLTVTQYSLLRNIIVSEPMSVSELARVMNLDRTTLVRNLKAVEKAGFVRSDRGKDARMRPINITATGEDAVARAMPYWNEAQKIVKSHLGEEDVGKLIALVEDIESMDD